MYPRARTLGAPDAARSVLLGRVWRRALTRRLTCSLLAATCATRAPTVASRWRSLRCTLWWCCSALESTRLLRHGLCPNTPLLCLAPRSLPRSQVRWAACLTQLLRTHKRLLRISLPWQPLMALLRDTHLRLDSGYEGSAITMSHISAITALLRASRRFFPAGSAGEIWQLLRPGLADVSSSDAMHATGWLALLLPCTHISWDESVAWSTLVSDFVLLLRSVPDCRYWSSLWLTTLARLAKHDLQGRVDWPMHSASGLSSTLSAFELPIGGSGGAPPWSRRAPRDASLLFGQEARSRAKVGAKLAVYSLGCEPRVGVQPQLDVLFDCLEHYAHPSNSGPWSGALATWMRSLVSFLMKRTSSETRRQPGSFPRAWGGTLPAAATSSFCAGVLRLASRAQFSRSSELARSSAGSIAALAYIVPSQALPLAVQRFQDALEHGVTATHQLVASLDTLSLCLRPLLASPKGTLDSLAGEGEPTDNPSTELMASALFALLPALDANDPPKTLAALRFFTAALSSIPGQLCDQCDGEQGGAAPSMTGTDTGTALPGMAWGSWLDELLSRLFVLLENLQPSDCAAGGDGGGGGDGSPWGSWLLQGNSLYRPFCELLFGRLAPTLRVQATRRVASLATDAALPGVTSELGILLAAAAWASSPQQAAQQLLRPLAAALLEEAEAHTPAPGAARSPSAELLLRSRAARLTACLHCVGEAASLCRPQLELCLDVLWAAAEGEKSQALWDCACGLTTSVLTACVAYLPMDMHAPEPPARDAATPEDAVAWDGTRVSAWVPTQPDGEGAGTVPLHAALRWHTPSEAELAFANALVEKYAEVPSAALSAAADGAALPAREVLRCALLQISSVLSGAKTQLPEEGRPMRDGAPYGLVGSSGPDVGRRGCRERVCAALAAAVSLVHADDTDALSALLHAADDALCSGHGVYVESQHSSHAWRVDASTLTQPRCAPIEMCPGDGHHMEPGGDTRRRRRRPRWISGESAVVNLGWRTSQAAYFIAGVPPADAVPPQQGSGAAALLSAVAALCSHRYKAVREEAAPTLEAALKRFPAAAGATLAPFVRCLGQGSSSADGGGDESALGAATVLSSRTCSRAAAADPHAHAALLRALMASYSHQGVRAQAACHDLFLVLAMRFSRAPPTAPCDDDAQREPGPMMLLRAELLASGDGGVDVPTHWRYALMKHALVAFLVRPGREGEHTGALVSYFAQALVSDLAPLRPLAAAALLTLLRGAARAQRAGHPACGLAQAAAAVRAALEAPGFAAKAFSQLALCHVVPDAGGAGGDSGNAGGSGSSHTMHGFLGSGEALWRAVAASSSPREWPEGKYCAGAPSGVFLPLHARLFRELASAAPTILLSSLRAPITAALTQGDRVSRAIAAEAISGCCAAAWTADADSELLHELTSWAIPAFLRAALEAPAEARGDWVHAAMFSVGGGSWYGGGAAGRKALLVHLAAPPPPGAASGTQARRLLLLRYALAAAARAAACGQDAEDVAFIAQTCADALKECTQLRDAPLRAVREEAAACAALLTALAAPATGCADCGGAEEIQPDAAHIFRASGAASRTAGDAMRRALAPESAAFEAGLEARASAAAAAVLSAAPPALRGADEASASQSASESAAAGPLASGGASCASGELAWMESALLWAAAATRHGDAAALSPQLLVLLPSILRVQQTRDPDFDLVAKRSLAYLKYAELRQPALGAALRCLVAATEAEEGAWHSRAAALAALAPLSLRHALLACDADAQAVRAAVVQRLADPRLEVRQLATQTLAGLLQGPATRAAPALRNHFIAAAHAAATASRRVKPASSVDETLATAHARVLGLSACILTAPYDCPEWLPPLVTALATAARSPMPPVRATVTATFAEFKRTHTDTWQATKAAFGEEAWSAAADGLELSPSYFC